MAEEAQDYVIDIKWLGVRRHHLLHLDEEVFQELTTRDLQILKGLCASPQLQNFPSYLDELRAMAECNKKAEIQAMHSVDDTYFENAILKSIIMREFD
mmetsp:Transcript_4983/g.18068  ORF Transcript_4983/g.18068 Transcript_4983/m.18068 type:complete len:98 (+) Transcript_4983:661-954(+)